MRQRYALPHRRRHRYTPTLVWTQRHYPLPPTRFPAGRHTQTDKHAAVYSNESKREQECENEQRRREPKHRPDRHQDRSTEDQTAKTSKKGRRGCERREERRRGWWWLISYTHTHAHTCTAKQTTKN